MAMRVLVTGASKGIGLSIARRLKSAGHTVIGTSRRPENAGISDFPLVALDLTDMRSIEAAAQAASAQMGGIDVLVNNAGFDLYSAAEETSPDELEAQMDSNFTGAAHLTRLVLPIMRMQGGGKIINMSSIGGRVSLPFNSAYAASKFALEGYSEALRYEVLPHRIYVSLVEPGPVHTDTLHESITSPQHNHPAYRTQRQRMTELMRESGLNSPVTPVHIAETVARIVNSPAPRLRYTVGRMARWLPLVKALLPEPLFERFIMNQFMQPRSEAAALGGHHAG